MHKFELPEFKALDLGGYIIVDARKSEIFAEGFIEDSISIPFTDDFIDVLSELVSDDLKVLLVADEADIPALVKMVKGSGLNNIKGYLAGGYEAWISVHDKYDMIIGIDADEFAIDYQFDEFYLIDLRLKEDFQKGHIEDAENIALNDLESLLVEMENQEMYYLYGETAAQAISAASILKRNGFQRLRAVTTAYGDLEGAGIPMFKPRKKDGPSAKHDKN
jgi:hydroxyacylglutathione hydrolase